MKTFGGRALFLDRSDINTDEIIPAKYLTEISKEALKPHLLEDLKLDGFDPKGEEMRSARAVVSRANLGCGSSREHAPWAFQVNGIELIVAESFARIFRQNVYNSGMLAVELPLSDIESIFAMHRKHGAVELTATVESKKLVAVAGQERKEFAFSLNKFEEDLVRADGWVAFANKAY